MSVYITDPKFKVTCPRCKTIYEQKWGGSPMFDIFGVEMCDKCWGIVVKVLVDFAFVYMSEKGGGKDATP